MSCGHVYDVDMREYIDKKFYNRREGGGEVKELIPVEMIERKIYLIRGQRVMMSMHLAELYGVETRALNQAVKRKIGRASCRERV